MRGHPPGLEDIVREESASSRRSLDPYATDCNYSPTAEAARRSGISVCPSTEARLEAMTEGCTLRPKAVLAMVAISESEKRSSQ